MERKQSSLSVVTDCREAKYGTEHCPGANSYSAETERRTDGGHAAAFPLRFLAGGVCRPPGPGAAL